MDASTWVQFYDKLSLKTKEGKLFWHLAGIHPLSGYDPSRSFTVNTGKIIVNLLWDNSEEDNLIVTIVYAPDTPAVYVDISDKGVSVAVKRLYNIVYNLLPDLESPIRDFIDNFE